MKKMSVILLIPLSILLTGCQKKYDANYIGLFYPKGSYGEKFIESPPFETLDECIDWIDNKENQMTDLGLVDSNLNYECQKNCTLGDKYSQGVKYTCETSVY